MPWVPELVMPRNRSQQAKGVPLPSDEDGQTVVFGVGRNSILEKALYHLDAERDHVDVSGNVVSQVRDQQGNVYAVAGTTGQIEYGPHTSPIGRRAYRFTNGDTHLVRSDTPLVQPFTAYVVFRGLSTSIGQVLFDSAPLGPTCWFVYSATGARINAGLDLLNSVPFDTDWHVADMVFNAGNSVVGFDGSRVSGQAGINDLEPLTVGAISGAAQGFYGELAELAILPGVYSEGQRNGMVSYLTRKWITG